MKTMRTCNSSKSVPNINHNYTLISNARDCECLGMYVSRSVYFFSVWFGFHEAALAPSQSRSGSNMQDENSRDLCYFFLCTMAAM